MSVNIEEHLGLARKIASEFSRKVGCKYTYDELESQAFLGLVKAGELFDESKGFKFSTFAIPRIKYELMRTYRDDKWYFSKRGCPHSISSLNIKIGSEEKQEEIQNLLQDEKNYESDLVNSILIKNLTICLTEIEKEIIKLYYYEGLRQPQIANIVNLSQCEVSRKLKKSLKKMKERLIAQGELEWVI